MSDYVTRGEHDRDIAALHARIDRTEEILESRFTHALDRLDDHLHSQDLWLRGILATVIGWAILHFAGIA